MVRGEGVCGAGECVVVGRVCVCECVAVGRVSVWGGCVCVWCVVRVLRGG